jgi:hypothetical protein
VVRLLPFSSRTFLFKTRTDSIHMQYKSILKRAILIYLFCLSAVVTFAQPDAPPDPGGGPIGAIPVDGGLAFLLAAGVGYGAKKAYDRRKSNKS